MFNQELSQLILAQTTDSVFLIKEHQIIESNRAAEQFLQNYHFQLDKILDICHSQGCALHSVMEKCHDCEIKQHFDPSAFSLVVENINGTKETFSASFTELTSEDFVVLIIRNLTKQDKTTNIFQQKQLVAYVSRAHENERKKIAQDLHDGIAQHVFSTLLEARQIKRTFETNQLVNEKLTQLEEHLVMTLDEVKTLALDLRPAALDDLGLASAITTLIHRMEETTGITINFISQLKHQRFNEQVEITLYRVLQEALMNAIKYAKVSELDVLLVEKDQSLVLEVLDEGVGFSANSPDIKGTGMGLIHIRERVEMIRGQLTIFSTKNLGTQLKVEVPTS
ncbi:histidine kinase [Carnobacterium gallinarum]|uniref:sensor histidine kinase n=1 Tax=Carnobacterium gallinarum TaxID=2749 RepID=UPI00054ECFD2|nr:sensor histidine kinase [Carnobacterium gallinarum]